LIRLVRSRQAALPAAREESVRDVVREELEPVKSQIANMAAAHGGALGRVDAHVLRLEGDFKDHDSVETERHIESIRILDGIKRATEEKK
jgi:hypothetical protein